MAMLVKYRDGSTELILRATRVDQQNYHEGTFDFYDESGALLKQIDMYMDITWEPADEPASNSSANPINQCVEEQGD